MKDILPKMTEILETEQIEMNDSLNSFDTWDSLTILMVIEFCSSDYGISLTAEEIENSGTIGGLQELIESKV